MAALQQRMRYIRVNNFRFYCHLQEMAIFISAMKKANKFRYFSLLTLVAFLMNVMLPFFVVYDVQQALASGSAESSSEEMSSLFGEKVLICTSDGFKWVSWEDLQNGKEQPKPHPQYQCALCYVAAHGIKNAVPAQEIEIAYHQNIQYISYYFSDVTTISKLAGRGFLTRAPPHIA